MHLMWGMMNTLLLLRYILKFNLHVPGNAYFFFYNMDAFLSMKAEFITDYMDKAQRYLLKLNNGGNGPLRDVSTYLFAVIALGVAMLITVGLV